MCWREVLKNAKCFIRDDSRNSKRNSLWDHTFKNEKKKFWCSCEEFSQSYSLGYCSTKISYVSFRYLEDLVTCSSHGAIPEEIWDSSQTEAEKSKDVRKILTFQPPCHAGGLFQSNAGTETFQMLPRSMMDWLWHLWAGTSSWLKWKRRLTE